ncbi:MULTISPECIES: hypothetical protein [Haloferax]|uniref:Lipoprotein n=1 Tax=Haloferax marinum TaxID=2666143 RepID=A0A6A8GA38_9EURY|nr:MULTISPECIES: hypothetical protein [Haloferax]KAB1191189.1 hypothetical protein Hfx1150_16050 [Haloferax sp. CBA1150]MRW98079.1 hypothetical protein [Haloferax marinum]
MSLQTRRQLLLSGGASLLTALAGCTGSGSSSSSRTPHGPRPEDLVTEYDYTDVRSTSGTPIFRAGDSDTSGSTLDAFLVRADEDLDDIDVVATPDGIDEVRRFIDETTFRSQSLVIVQHRVDACHDMKLNYVVSPPDHFVDADFCYVLRDAAVECSVDDRHVVASLIRLPFSDSDRDASGWSQGGGRSCRLPPSLRNESTEGDT